MRTQPEQQDSVADEDSALLADSSSGSTDDDGAQITQAHSTQAASICALAPAPNPFYSTTYLLVLAVMAVDAADMSLVPAVFFEISAEFEVGPELLGTVTLCRGLAQSLVALVAGPLGNRFSRVKLVGAGCILWAVATAAVGASSSAAELLIARAVNGLGLGLVIPISWSLVSDIFPDSARGRAFGVLFGFSHLGGTFGAAAATAAAGYNVFGTLSGWRCVFFASAVVSSLAGCLILVFGVEPRNAVPAGAAPPLSLTSALAEFRQVWKVRTFKVILAQGAPGTMPGYAHSFLTMWFELFGFSHVVAASIRMSFDVGRVIGSVFSGFAVDAATKWSPDHGKAAVAQVLELQCSGAA